MSADQPVPANGTGDRWPAGEHGLHHEYLIWVACRRPAAISPMAITFAIERHRKPSR